MMKNLLDLSWNALVLSSWSLIVSLRFDFDSRKDDVDEKRREENQENSQKAGLQEKAGSGESVRTMDPPGYRGEPDEQHSSGSCQHYCPASVGSSTLLRECTRDRGLIGISCG